MKSWFHKPDKPLTFDVVTTKTGDTGESGLYDNTRRAKSDLVFTVLGDIDETHAFVGRFRLATAKRPGLSSTIEAICEDFLAMGAIVASPNLPKDRLEIMAEGIADRLIKLEERQQAILATCQIKLGFVTYGTHAVAADVDVARSVCRRAERAIVSLIRDEARTELFSSQKYLNRLSDYLYVVARGFEQGLF